MKSLIHMATSMLTVVIVLNFKLVYMVSVIDTLKVFDKGGWQDQISACLFTSIYSFFDSERDCLGMIHHITVDRNWYEISALTIASWFAAWFEPGVSALHNFFSCQSDWLRIARNFSLIIRNLLHQKCVTKKAFWLPISLSFSFSFLLYICKMFSYFM